MKVLFAVSNENISESIIKKYQQEYKEIISSKNVYYFNAIAKELQKDKTYDRIVISEDLEPFANNNYEVIDKFIFEKLDAISDEATSNNGQDIPIILICADRRVKSESLLVKLFGIGIYSALLGQDRSITSVCQLINKPRSKKEAKVYYRIDSDDVDYKSESEGDVSEVEIQNILNHYKRLGKNEEKYVESFDNIATQYTDAQLRVICKFLPLNVKAVLEASSQKYQELITFGTVTPSSSVKPKVKQPTSYQPNSDYQKNVKKIKKKQQETTNLDVIERNLGKANLTKPVIIPSEVNVSNVKKKMVSPTKLDETVQNTPQQNEDVNDILASMSDLLEEKIMESSEKPSTSIDKDVAQSMATEAPKKKRGRPKKVQSEEEIEKEAMQEAPKKKRGRPKKVQPEEEITVLPGVEETIVANEEPEDTVNLFDLGDEDEIATPTVHKEETAMGGIVLPGLEEDEDVVEEIPMRESESYTPPSYTGYQEQKAQEIPTREIENMNRSYENLNLDSLLTRDKKVVAFVGTSKNGTSFLVNNLADVLSKKGIKTAILDLTRNKNSYYIYTQNEEPLRKKAYSCINGLRNGIADGIQVNKNLTVYTTLPEENPDFEDYQNILKTLVQNYSLILMDCDFETPYGYFKHAQELYLVQSFDILTIQPLTAFLRDLKSKNILDPEKIRIVLNKVLRVRSVTERMIIGGMAFYNDPAMSFMTELFNKDNVKYCTIPFEEETYSRYLEGLVNCEISTNGYSKNFMMSFDKLSNMVYPLLSNNKLESKSNTYQPNGFSSNMNETLNKMKKNY